MIVTPVMAAPDDTTSLQNQKEAAQKEVNGLQAQLNELDVYKRQIGESVKRILRYKGNKVIGDIHLGDWGYQMGLIITCLLYTSRWHMHPTSGIRIPFRSNAVIRTKQESLQKKPISRWCS